jgi:SpoVK/Ycf46/Vps4 family AAA+-type ATPase
MNQESSSIVETRALSKGLMPDFEKMRSQFGNIVDGLVIVASNLRKNMDNAFSRRFENLVFFDVLNPELSKRYWETNLPPKVTLSEDIDLAVIVKRYQLSPASIINVINRVCLV